MAAAIPSAQHPRGQGASVQGAAAAQLVSKALTRAAEVLGLSQKDVARVIGVSEATVSRVFGAKTGIDPSSKEGELALLLLRMFRSLDALLGGKDEDMRAWLRANNVHLAGTPKELIGQVTGLVHVVEYLDAMRGHL